MAIIPWNTVHAQSYRENTYFLLQKVEPLTDYYVIPLKNGLVLPYFHGYYVVTEKALLDFFENDSCNSSNCVFFIHCPSGSISLNSIKDSFDIFSH